MRALLINPYTIIPRAWTPYFPDEPLALEYLAAVAADGHQVRIFDCVGEFLHQYKAMTNGRVRVGAYPEQIRAVIETWRPDLVGITMPFMTIEHTACSIADLVKEIDGDIVTVAGGAYVCAVPERVLSKNPSVDIVVVGEGELTFKELLDKEANGLDRIKGIVYRKGNNIVRNEPRELIDNLDEIPFPRRDLVPFDNYSSSLLSGSLRERINMLATWLRYNRDWDRLGKRLYHAITSGNRALFRTYSAAKRASMLTSRGCPFNCYFCSLHSVYRSRYRMRSSQNVLEEVEMLVKDYGVGAIGIMDENFNLSKERVIGICEGIIERGLHLTLISYGMYLAPWLDLETLSLIKKAGFHEIFFGIENADQEIVTNVLNKKIDLNKVPEVVGLCKNAGIISGGMFIVGVPGETIKSMEDTVRYALTSGLEKIQLRTFQPAPGTKLYDDCVKNGWLVDGYDPSKSVDTSSRSYVRTPEFSPEDVFRIAEKGKKLLRKAGKLDQAVE